MKYLFAVIFIFLGISFMAPESLFAAPIVAGSFSTTWDTSTTGRDGESNSDQIIFSLWTGGDGETCSGELYWEEIGNDSNNGTISVTTCEIQITFPDEGNYRVDASGSFPSFQSPDDIRKLQTVE